jgi:hypothetical protein
MNKNTQTRKVNVEEILRQRWNGMISRCYCEGSTSYDYYGGRGIKVCDEWRGHAGCEAFIVWALEHGFKPDLEIDRLNNDSDYSPENCRWATRAEQCRNRRDAVYFTHDGVTLSAAEWAEKTGIAKGTLYQRRSRGWTDDQALGFEKHKKHEDEQ